MEDALSGERPSDVPCDGCTACCTSSQFVHIGPEETDTLAHIPAELLFPAPRMPRGHVLLGYDERGHCPMLADGKCSIYQHRPRTCRTYDCRVFAATGVEPDADKPLIAARARRWRFTIEDHEDERLRSAVVRAAAALAELGDDRPVNATQQAVLAVEIHQSFTDTDAGPGPDVVRQLISRSSRRRTSGQAPGDEFDSTE